MIKNIFLWIVAMALIGGIVAGCGGGDDSDASGSGETTVTTSSRTKAEFIKLANKICERDKTRMLTELGLYVKQRSGEGKSQSVLITEGIREVVMPSIQKQVDEIRALGAPKGEEKQVEAVLTALREGVDAGSKATPTGSGAKKKSTSPNARFTEADTIFTEDFKRSAQLARKYGLVACAYA